MASRNVLEWIEPRVVAFVFQELRPALMRTLVNFTISYLTNMRLMLAKGIGFEEDSRYMDRDSWDTSEKLQKGLNNILKAIGEAKDI
jgi:hypothetical protein